MRPERRKYRHEKFNSLNLLFVFSTLYSIRYDANEQNGYSIQIRNAWIPLLVPRRYKCNLYKKFGLFETLIGIPRIGMRIRQGGSHYTVSNHKFSRRRGIITRIVIISKITFKMVIFQGIVSRVLLIASSYSGRLLFFRQLEASERWRDA